ncbi:MAG: transketolase C-terminal domain-containing protein, partial [Chloroflexota bacterium]
TDMAWSEDVLSRFDAYGWHTARVEDGNDLAAIEAAIRDANADDRPSLIAVRTHIGFGSPNKQDTQKAHGSPLGPDEVRLTKIAYGWDPDAQFLVPPAVGEAMGAAVPAGEALVKDWEARYYQYRDAFPDEAAELRRRDLGLGLRDGWDSGLKTYAIGEDFATRQASQAAIQALAGTVPELFGGSADLSESNLTLVKDADPFEAGEAGRNLWFGVREHAMGGIANGIAYHRGFIPYAGTFLNFSDYMRGSVRLAALAGLHVIYVWTHDSVGLGEDGPTHQPIEHYAALRAMPNLWFVRPGDANEATAAWALAVQHTSGPVALALTRQKLPTLPGSSELASDGVARGGYVLRKARGEDAGKAPDLLLIATGSELQLAFAAAEALEQDSIHARVVSLPCWEAFDAQDEAYRESVIPKAVRRRVTIEIGATLGWERYAGDEGAILGVDHYGASAPAGTIFEKFGFTTDRVVDVARRVVRDGLRGRIPTLDRGEHPTMGAGDSGVDRTDKTDPGHS